LSGRLIAVLLVPAAAVVAVVAVALRLHFQPPTVPAYALAADAGGEVTLRPGMPFEMVAHPSAPSAGVVAAKGFLFRGQERRLWEPPFTVDADGTLRIAGPVDALFKGVPPGTWDLAVAVGRPETLPSMPGDVEHARDAAGPAAWHVLRQRVNLTSE
jgi:hypothetical protein